MVDDSGHSRGDNHITIAGPFQSFSKFIKPSQFPPHLALPAQSFCLDSLSAHAHSAPSLTRYPSHITDMFSSTSQLIFTPISCSLQEKMPPPSPAQGHLHIPLFSSK